MGDTDGTFTITTNSATITTIWIFADTGTSFEDPIETMKREFTILADKFLEKYRDEIV
ncbi:hypothetical protein LCGC14_2249830 [marine sediment metagenome]|uniref:Uncharacterized protein n=1 Tax=marine sediment metagenome TaxID=412755 RepID=A0A0F9D386_9ZZZZ